MGLYFPRDRPEATSPGSWSEGVQVPARAERPPPKAECNSAQISLGPGETADCDEPAKNKRPEVEGGKSNVRVLTIVQATIAGKGVDRGG